MNRNLGVGILIFCFSCSTVNFGWAAEAMEVSPVVVQPYEIQELNQQMIDRDRQNRDEEIAIRGLVEENDKLAQATLARQQDEGLAKIDQTMLSYRDALLSRDRTRIVANGERQWSSRYGDLIALTEDADAMTVHQDLEDRSGLLAEKYQMLTQLKDEMTALNDKLKGESEEKLEQKDTTIEGFKKTSQEQQDKIQMLVGKLSEMDQKIARLDDSITKKDEEIAKLRDDLSIAQSEVVTKDEIIKNQKIQIAILQGKPESQIAPASNKMELPPIVVTTAGNNQPTAPVANPSAALARIQSELSSKDQIIKDQEDQIALLKAAQTKDISTNNTPMPRVDLQQLSKKQEQIDLLKSELENKITELNDQGHKDQIIKQQEDQIAVLKAQSQELSSKEELIKAQADQMAKAAEQFKDQSVVYAQVKDQVTALKDKMQQQSSDIKAKDESIRWLNQVLAVAKDKAEYYQLTSQQDQMSMKQVQDEVQSIKDDFARRFKDYDQFETAVTTLKNQVAQLGLQLSQKQAQVEQLKSQLADKTAQNNDQQIQNVKMKADVLAILQAQANKEIYRRNAAAQVDDRIKLAQQLIDLQEQEASLLEEKSGLYEAASNNFDKHFLVLEKQINEFLAKHQLQAADTQNQMQELKNELSQKEEQVTALNAQLQDKIAQEKNMSILDAQIQDLKAQLQDRDDRIATMKKALANGQKTNEEVDSLRQELASAQDKADQLKQLLDSKSAQADQMNSMLADYQKKLEGKDVANNDTLRQMLSAKNDQSLMEKEIANLNARLQEKEAQVINIKKNMYDLQELEDAKDKDAQTKDLNLSMIQQKTLDDKINEYQEKINALQATNVNQAQKLSLLRADLALARQQLEGMPSSDEIDFLRKGLKSATTQLKQKEQMLSEIKANADEYVKEFKEQSLEFHSLKDQLLDAQQALQRKDEDLKYKDMALTRLKGIDQSSEGDLKAQVMALTKRVELEEKKFTGVTHENKLEALQAQLKNANEEIKALQTKLRRLNASDKDDPLEEKLKQALDKIDQQGRVISTLFQKLQDCGKTVDLSKV